MSHQGSLADQGFDGARLDELGQWSAIPTHGDR
jgi:hypothetical protein